MRCVQGPVPEEVEVVHAVDFLPIRVDAHRLISENIGYLALKYKTGRKYWVDRYVNTRRWVFDLLIQNFFPGPTWLAVYENIGGGEPVPPFIDYRLKAIMSE
jgi:hypothetical protein